MEIVAGCYEKVLFGYRVKVNDDGSWEAVADFTHQAHLACVTAVAASDRFVATGSADEAVHLYDLQRRVEHGALLQHSGTITCLEFYGSTHMLSGAQDGSICIWDTKTWKCLKTIRAHKGHVSAMSVHPSGKLALSVGTDKTLRTWNLVEGRSAFIKNIKRNAELVLWSPSGNVYALCSGPHLDVYRLETATVTGSIVMPARIASIRFVTEDLIATAGGDEFVRLHSVETLKEVCTFKAHESRVKALYTEKHNGQHVLASASSDGSVKLWRVLPESPEQPPEMLLEVNTTARLTCLAVWKPQEVASQPQAKRKQGPRAKVAGDKAKKKRESTAVGKERGASTEAPEETPAPAAQARDARLARKRSRPVKPSRPEKPSPPEKPLPGKATGKKANRKRKKRQSLE
ncbi:p21-activated protein kinase-interacting protein 1 [Lethenteron reissneri]|uniref:p21-activated protein kinase-interacting protein 1 n=1 Tax=Lethenteron reissneri TaxID=7753 RepID=UPI002AB7BA3D|nr:p21-activated protein kinase-interacting protein 1 [Lethenteron reissneri]